MLIDVPLFVAGAAFTLAYVLALVGQERNPLHRTACFVLSLLLSIGGILIYWQTWRGI